MKKIYQDSKQLLETIWNLRKELENSRIFYDNLFKNNSQPMWIYDLETLRFLDVNNAAINHYGYSREEFLSMTIADIRPPEDVNALIKDVKSTTKRYNNAGVWKHLKKNGELISVEIVSHSLTFNSRKARHVRVTDITEWEKLEQSLKDNDIILKLFIENAPASLAMFDREMNYITHSKRWVKDYNLKEENLTGRCHYDVFPEIGDDWKDLHRRGMNGEVLINERDEFRRADGSLQILRWEVRPWLFSNGETGGIIVFTEDITEETVLSEEIIEAKNRAEEGDRLKSAFLANISHEIRTPLNSILGFSELLRDDDLTKKEMKEYLDIINLSGNRMLNTINNIISISKIESGKLKRSESTFSIKDMLQYLERYFRFQAESKRLNFFIKSEVSPKSDVLTTDYEKLMTILYNLIENAIKYTQNGGIEVICREDSGKIVFIIKDTGIGISGDQQKSLFGLFRQADAKHSRHYEGSGIGLYLCKTYVKLLGGCIDFESIPGMGSTFRVIL